MLIILQQIADTAGKKSFRHISIEFSSIKMIYPKIELSYNQPKLPGCPQWDPNGITFANEIVVGRAPLDVFVDRNNAVYVTDESNEEIHIWSADSVIPTTITLDHPFHPWSLFVTINLI
jgi:hypothetical protein